MASRGAKHHTGASSRSPCRIISSALSDSQGSASWFPAASVSHGPQKRWAEWSPEPFPRVGPRFEFSQDPARPRPSAARSRSEDNSVDCEIARGVTMVLAGLVSRCPPFISMAGQGWRWLPRVAHDAGRLSRSKSCSWESVCGHSG